MFQTPSRATPVKTTKGLFRDGEWLCNCEPRQLASRNQVKKQGPTNGRWFYTCKKHSKRSDNCGFFLWEDQARRRENESRPRPSTPEPSYSELSPTPTPTTPSTVNTNKRKYREVNNSSDDEFGGLDVSPEEAAQMEMNASRSSRASRSTPMPQTPRKAIKTEPLDTPGRIGGLPTPVTGGRTLEGSRDIQTPSASPEDSIERRAEMGKTGYSITDDVLEVLKGKTDGETTGRVKDICDRFGMKLSGIERGRDITRTAVKSKDEKIEQLRKRVVALENEVEKKKAVIRAMADSL